MELPTPVLFLKDVRGIPNAMLQILGLPVVYYKDSGSFSLNQLVTLTLGMNMFQVLGILGLTFLASIVLVTIILPNVYFRLMLFTDNTVDSQHLAYRMFKLHQPDIFIDDDTLFYPAKKLYQKSQTAMVL